MTEPALTSRTGPFWDFLAGRQPAPPAAATLGWELSWVSPERGEIEVFFDASDRSSGRRWRRSRERLPDPSSA